MSTPSESYVISDDPARLDVEVIHGFLTTCYWSPGVTRATVERAIAGSLNFGVYHTQGAWTQVGYGRVITDYATFAYIADVFVLEPHRGRGLSKRLMRTILEHPRLRDLRRWCLLTRDAQGLYAGFGFVNLDDPRRYMEISDPRAGTDRD